MGTATAGTMVTVIIMGVATATERQEHRSKFAGKSKPVAKTSARSHSATGSAVYIKVVADLLPKEANINVEAGEAFVNLWRRISDGLGEELADSLDAEQEHSAPVRH